MTHSQLSEYSATDRVRLFSTSHSADVSANLGEPENDYLQKHTRVQLCTGTENTPGEGPGRSMGDNSRPNARQFSAADNSRMTIGRFVETKFLPEYVTLKRSSGQAFYRAMLKHVLAPEEVDRMSCVKVGEQRRKLKSIQGWPYLDNLRFCDVGAADVTRLTSAALAHGYSIQTVKHIRNVIGAIFVHAKQERCFMGNNPVGLVKPPATGRRIAFALTPAQAIEALGIMQYPEREMTLIGVFTGMGPAEILGLQWKHVNLADHEISNDGVRTAAKTICVRRRWYRGKSERVRGNCVRDLPITLPLSQILQRLKNRSCFTAPEDYILVSSSGTPINHSNIMARRLRPIASQLGVPSLSWQAFRRTHDTLASELDNEFGFSVRATSLSVDMDGVELGAWPAQQTQRGSI